MATRDWLHPNRIVSVMTGSYDRRLVAVMFTDVVGYTSMMQEDEEAARRVRRRHRKVLEAALSTHDGELLQYLGDGSLSIFPSAVKAVFAAIEVQRAAQESPAVPLRIGLHQGEIAFDTQGGYGDSVNIASRIEGLAEAGSVLISDKVYDEVKNQPGLTAKLLGEIELKNVKEPATIYAVVATGLVVPQWDGALDRGYLPPPEKVGGYRLLEVISTGGMATVYLAEDPKHGREVAVKILNPDLAEALGAERFLREIRTTANLHHPHILQLFDSGEAEGLLYFVMPLVKGESLRSRLRREKQLPIQDALQITREIMDALAYAHEEGVIHRDVKPANIMLEAGHAYLADFGVARALAEADDMRITRSGLSLGTPAYMSPEQATGRRDLDHRSDQYALACVLYEMLVGYPPFSGPTAESVARQHLAVPPPEITSVRPSVPAEVEQVIGRAMAKLPADRYGSMAAMAAALGGAVPAQRRQGWRRLFRPRG